MVTFTYHAVDREGRPQKGTLEADTREVAILQLQAKIFTPIRLEERHSSTRGYQGTRRRAGAFTRNLAMLVQAGYTIDQALAAMCRHGGDRNVSALAASVLTAVRGGSSFSEALQAQPKTFPTHFVMAAEAGQASGALGRALLDLSDDEERRAKLIGDVQGALAYPIVLGVGMLLALIFMMIYVLPRFGTMFEDMRAEVPAGLAHLLAASTYIQHNWHYLIAGLGVILAISILLLRTREGRNAFDHTMLKSPVIGPMVTAALASRFFHVLAMLLRNGQSAAPALASARRSISNTWARARFDYAFQRVREGQSAAREIAATGVLPPLASDLLSASEDAGVLAEGAARLAELYEAELEKRTRFLVQVSEPLMLGISGLLIGSMIVSIVSALIGVNETLAQ